MAERFLIGPLAAPEGAPVSESMQKKLDRNGRLQQEKQAAVAKLTTEKRASRHALKLRTLHYDKEYRDAAKEITALNRDAKLNGNFYKMPDPKVVFCVRIKGINKLSPKPKKILQLFRLRQINNGVFIRINKATQEMLRVIEPFVTYGYPTLGTIRRLVYKRGYARVGRMGARQRIRIQSNDIVSEHLGKFGIHGVEDMVHELYTCGSHFKDVSNFLWPFKLSCPRGGLVAKRHGFCEPCGGDWGNREALINPLVSRMN